MKFIAKKMEDGRNKRKVSFYCRVLKVSRQGFYKYLKFKNKPWKYQELAETMIAISKEDLCNDTYGRVRMRQALEIRQIGYSKIPSERTIYRIMEKIGISHCPKRKANGITRTDRKTQRSEDLFKRDFSSDAPLKKCVTGITEIKSKDGKLYVSAIFDCYDCSVLGLAMDDNMKASLCKSTVENAYLAYPGLRGAIVHSDRGSQYTSYIYREVLKKCGIKQSLNSSVGRYHDNVRCESFWDRMKEELLYNRYNTKNGHPRIKNYYLALFY